MGAVLLAAGASRRLGFPKQGAYLEGERRLARTVRLALEAGLGPLRVVLGFEPERIKAFLGPWLTDERLDICIHTGWEEGMGTSLSYGVSCKPWPQDIAGLLILLCDQTALDLAHLQSLLKTFALDPTQRVASRYDGVWGAPAVFPIQDLSALTALKGDQGARKLLREGLCVPCDWSLGALDFDTPES